jgi:hypothetical protein
VALSPLLWLATPTAGYGKTVGVEPVTVERYGRMLAFLEVGDTVVTEELIRGDWRECSPGIATGRSTSGGNDWRRRDETRGRDCGQCRMQYRRGRFRFPGIPRCNGLLRLRSSNPFLSLDRARWTLSPSPWR